MHTHSQAVLRPGVNSANDPTEPTQKSTVAMPLSGGVDSSVSLNLLLQQGYDVTAFYLKIWLEDEFAHLGKDACPWEDDYRTCVAVCEHAGGVPLETLSLQREYRETVIKYTIEEAKRGRTPNPDIMCNSRVKFGCFYDVIQDRGFDFVASGHYAQLVQDNDDNDGSNDDTFSSSPPHPQERRTTMSTDGRTNRVKLLRAPDPIKDQSYFLAALTQTQLNRVLFPIGHLHKTAVRTLATELNLPNQNRPDSQGLCFLGKIRFDDFLAAHLQDDPGDIIDADTGDIIGRHRGLWFHTIGQRKGIGRSLDPKATNRGPWYVVAKDPVRKLVLASNRYDGENFDETRRSFHVEGVRWISEQAPESDGGSLRTTMKIRHGPTLVEGYLRLLDADGRGNEGEVVLDTKDGGLAPGQFVAFYDGVECLGSGIISERHWDAFCSTTQKEQNI